MPLSSREISCRSVNWEIMGQEPFFIMTTALGRCIAMALFEANCSFLFGENYKHHLLMMACDCSLPFAEHCAHGPADLQFSTPETTTLFCQSGVTGTNQNCKFDQNGHCPSIPRPVVNIHYNPMCTIETYQGGLFCCNHGQFLLGHNQTIP